jgi:hypothetical protein
MASLTHKLLKLTEKRTAGKRAIVKIHGIPHEFVSVMWGGSSPHVTLRMPDGTLSSKTAADWKRLGAEL